MLDLSCSAHAKCYPLIESWKVSTFMRAFRICVCCLLAFPLLGIRGCPGKYGGQTKFPMNCDKATNTCTVTIDASCTPAMDMTPVVLEYTVTLSAPDNTYSVQFLGSKTPFHPSSGKVTVVVAGTPSKPVTGDKNCSATSHPPASTSNPACYFYYDVYHGNTACGDPGIHVIPY